MVIHPLDASQPKVSLIFLKSQHSFRHLSLGGRLPDHCDDLELKILPRSVIDGLIQEQKTSGLASRERNDSHGEQLVIEHYECCHKPLPEFSNIDTLSEVHHALGFLPEPSFKQVLLEELVGLDDDLSLLPGDAGPDHVQKRSAATKAVHCLKVINGELFLLCNIRTRGEFIDQNLAAFEEASCIEVSMPVPGAAQPQGQPNPLPPPQEDRSQQNISTTPAN